MHPAIFFGGVAGTIALGIQSIADSTSGGINQAPQYTFYGSVIVAIITALGLVLSTWLSRTRRTPIPLGTNQIMDQIGELKQILANDLTTIKVIAIAEKERVNGKFADLEKDIDDKFKMLLEEVRALR